MQDEDPTSDSELDEEEEEDAKPARKRTKTSSPGIVSCRQSADREHAYRSFLAAALRACSRDLTAEAEQQSRRGPLQHCAVPGCRKAHG